MSSSTSLRSVWKAVLGASCFMLSVGCGPAEVSGTGDTSAAETACGLTDVLYASVNPTTGAELLTVWKAEADGAASNYGFTQRHTLGVNVSATAKTGLSPVHRLYQPTKHDFLYTIWSTEVASAVSKYGYQDNGVVFYASQAKSTCAGQVLYGGYNAKTGTRNYDVSQTVLTSTGYSSIGSSFYVHLASATTTPPAPPPPPPSGDSKPAAVTAPGFVWHSSVPWKAYVAETDPTLKRKYWNIAGTPMSIWIGGTSGDGASVKTLIAQAAAVGQVPTFVLYAIPDRDCGGYAAGGIQTEAAYDAWIDSLRAGIGSSKVIFIVEPDAISFCDNTRAERSRMMTYAAKTLSQDANAALYVHAGSGELPLDYAVSALKDVGVQYIRGFALNVSSHGGTAREETYGDQLVQKLAAAGVTGKHYIVDTSRNGVGDPPSDGGTFTSCNNSNAALGTRPTANTTGQYADAYLWVKPPGESDGACHPGDLRGWFPKLAQSLVDNALAHGILNYWTLP